MINTLNETHLHRTLKHIYAMENEGSTTEAQAGQYIADILTPEGNVIEIQTGNISHLRVKISQFIKEKRKVTVVYPVPAIKYIETRSSDGTLLRRKKSPAKKNIYSAFKELTGLTEILLGRNFTLHILETEITEERRETAEPVQSANRHRRFRKCWLKTGKRLEKINTKTILHGKKSYLALLPRTLPERFTVKTLATETGTKEEDIRIMLWVFLKLGLLEREKEGRGYVYFVK